MYGFGIALKTALVANEWQKKPAAKMHRVLLYVLDM